MGSAVLKILFVLAIPVVISVVASYLMMHITGRDQFPQTTDPDSVPLYLRFKGYGQKAATAYWTWLSNDGRVAEQRFLEADLVFPFFYGGAMLISLLLAWVWLERPFDPTWLVMPVAVTVLADWIENLVQLLQLGHFVRSEPLHGNWIQVASIATTTKCVFLGASTLLILSLCVWMVLHAVSASK
jgi:hypothetical protein